MRHSGMQSDIRMLTGMRCSKTGDDEEGQMDCKDDGNLKIEDADFQLMLYNTGMKMGDRCHGKRLIDDR